MKNKYPIVKSFSKRLRELRLKNGLTQEKLAEMSEISYKNIQYLESKDPTCPSLVTIHKLAKAFKMPMSKLLDIK
ncbi:MAG: helix-turn-helix transcriptional regulator [Candidatus Omnitrophica bacterium]|nr:helix-turn-helix transcriptional regulator [Candidatus Omnitrophota bacterium]MDD5081081.1 helix-turn-helix transcriptional regulator [Candidatus Omnitrophota bacterium]